MKTSPWFSIEEETDEVPRPVYHDNTSCLEGDKILKNRRRYGTDNRPLCPKCSRLDETGR